MLIGATVSRQGGMMEGWNDGMGTTASIMSGSRQQQLAVCGATCVREEYRTPNTECRNTRISGSVQGSDDQVGRNAMESAPGFEEECWNTGMERAAVASSQGSWEIVGTPILSQLLERRLNGSTDNWGIAEMQLLFADTVYQEHRNSISNTEHLMSNVEIPALAAASRGSDDQVRGNAMESALGGEE